MKVGWVNVVCIATCCRLDGPGFKYRLGRNFPHPSSFALGPTPPLVQWVPSGWGVALITHSLLVPRSKKDWDYTSTPPVSLQGKLYLFSSFIME